MTKDWLQRNNLSHYESNFKSFDNVRALAQSLYPNGINPESVQEAERKLQQRYAVVALGARRKIVSGLQQWANRPQVEKEASPESIDLNATSTALLTKPSSGQRLFRAPSGAPPKTPPRPRRIANSGGRSNRTKTGAGSTPKGTKVPTVTKAPASVSSSIIRSVPNSTAKASETATTPTESVGTTAKRPLWPIFQPGYVAPAPPTKRPRSAPGLLTASNSGQRLFRAPSGSAPAAKSKRKKRSDSGSGWSGGGGGGRSYHLACHRVPGTSFVIDSFRVSKECDDATMHFLTHMHSDHYGGLTKTSLRPGAQVLCSPVTARLAKQILRLPDELIRELPMGKGVDIKCPSVPSRGATVWLYNANHCPGAVVLLFRVWATGEWVLHSGDCRFEHAHFAAHTQLRRVVEARALGALYLDTTYAGDGHDFPAQQVVLDAVAEAALAEDRRTNGRARFFVGSYTIGKERVALAVARALGARIFADARKRALFRASSLGKDFDDRLTTRADEARVHVVAMGALSADGVRKHAAKSKMDTSFIGRALAVVVKPTGWSFRPGINAPVRRSCRAGDNAVVLDVAYSEHSSLGELRQFVRWARPRRIVPTVGFHGAENQRSLAIKLGHIPPNGPPAHVHIDELDDETLIRDDGALEAI